MSPIAPDQILAKLPRHLKTPLALAEALNITLPSTPGSLEYFETFLALQATSAAVKAQQQLVALIDSPSPTLALRACLTVLSLAGHHPAKPAPSPKTKSSPALAHALLWLYQLLLPAPLPAQAVLLQAFAANIKRDTLYRAKSLLKIHSRKSGSLWSWSLPAKPDLPPNPSANSTNHSPLPSTVPCPPPLS